MPNLKLSEVIIIKMTRKEALEHGLLNCKHCRLPVNNHFDWGERKCAHDSNCPGYEEKARVGTLIKK